MYSTTTVTTTPGTTYSLSGDWRSSGGTWQLVAGTAAGLSDLAASTAAGSGSTNLAFTATGTTTYISVVSVGTEPFGEYVEIDNISVREDTGEVSYSGGTTITLPADYYLTAEEQARVQVVNADGEAMVIASVTATTITLREEFTGESVFYVGIPYTMRYEMTKPMLKVTIPGTNTVEAQSIGRHQLRYMTVLYNETAFFKVRITPEVAEADGEPIEYPYSGRFLSTGGYLGAVPSSDGKFRFPVFAESDAVKIEILNDSPFPSNIQSISFEANYSPRSQRYS